MFRIYLYGVGLLFGEYRNHTEAHRHMEWEHPIDDYTLISVNGCQ